MVSIPDAAQYRLRLADGFLEEARQDFTLQRWRSCASDSQLAAENAAKAAGRRRLAGPGYGNGSRRARSRRGLSTVSCRIVSSEMPAPRRAGRKLVAR